MSKKDKMKRRMKILNKILKNLVYTAIIVVLLTWTAALWVAVLGVQRITQQAPTVDHSTLINHEGVHV
jgi:hypothetical protein